FPRMAHRGPFALAVSFLLVASAATGAPPDAPAAAAGIRWTVPAAWTAGKASPMRVATYAVPPAKGAEAGECAVFFFGTGQGGGVSDNVARWGKQFEGAPSPATRATVVSGLKVTRAEVKGTYLAPGGPMMQSTGKRPGYRLLGAIVEAPEGNVFFKLTGPAATIAAAEASFEALVSSVRRR
ncbi:MAG TPA: hypothetical protein VGB87_23590, partial [Vicinamibacteria bacterium]